MSETKAERITDTIIFHHRRITNPTVSAAHAIVTAAEKLTATIQNNLQHELTTLELKDLERLAEIFQQAATQVSEENARQPRVENDAATPRVKDSAIPRVDEPEAEVPDLCTPAEARKISAQMSKTPRVDTGSPRPMSVSYEQMEPRYATRQQRRLRGSIATDAMLSVIECSQANLAPQRLASR
jgi:hypothetical protein